VAALSTVCELSSFDELITDDGISAEQLAALCAMPLRVTVVKIDRRFGPHGDSA